MKILKKTIKKVGNASSIQWIVGFLLSLYVRLLHVTNRWTFEGFHHLKPYQEKDRPVIVCFWHGRLMMMVYGWASKKPFYMLQAGHRDGVLINRCIYHFGVRGVFQTKGPQGASAVFLRLRRLLRKGAAVGITPDGPRGPRHEVKKGIAALALHAGCDVVPMAYSLSRSQQLKSWDRFMVGLPFGRGALVCGKPLSAKDCAGDLDAFQKLIQNALITTTKRADFLCNVEVSL